MAGRRVALVFPRVRYRAGDPPLGIAYLAAALRRARPDEHRLLAAVRSASADVVGVFVDSLMVPIARRVAGVARRSGAVVVAGGPHASVAPEQLVPDFDAVLCGEGELLVPDLVDRALARAPFGDLPNLVIPGPDGGPPIATVTTPARPVLDDLPFPAWDLLEMDRYVRLWPYLDCIDVSTPGTDLVGSRGCPWSCTYCQPTLRSLFGRQVRRRSPESIVAEIEALQNAYGVRGVFFHDDTIAAHRRWLLSLCDALGRMEKPVLWGCNSRVDVLDEDLVDAMVTAGMRSIHLGIESGSRRVREDVLDKHVDVDRLVPLLEHLRRRGAHALGFFMLGSPTESVGEMLQTIALASRLRLTEATFSLTSVLPGTRLHDRVSGDDRFVLHDGHTAVRGAPEDEPIDYYSARNFEDRTSPVGARTLRTLQLGALLAFYGHPYRADYLLRHLTSRRGLVKLAMKAARFVKPLARLLPGAE